MSLKGTIALAALCLLVIFACAATHVISWHKASIALTMLPLFGAVTTNPISNPSGLAPYKTLAIFQVIATADGDTTATLTHNFALTTAQQPNTEIGVTMMQSHVAAAVPAWSITARGANSCTATKNATVGSGLAGAQVEFRVRVPHTMQC